MQPRASKKPGPPGFFHPAMNSLCHPKALVCRLFETAWPGECLKKFGDTSPFPYVRSSEQGLVQSFPREIAMNLEKVVFGFFIIFAATLNFGFFIGDFDNPAHHDVYELFAAITVNLIAIVLKLGDRTQIGALQLAASLVAGFQLIAAAIIWLYAVQLSGEGMTAAATTRVVAFAGGALLANIISVTLLIGETLMLRR